MISDENTAYQMMTDLEIIDLYNSRCCKYDNYTATAYHKELKFIEEEIIARFDVIFVSFNQKLDFKREILFDEDYESYNISDEKVLYFIDDFTVPKYPNGRLVTDKNAWRFNPNAVRINYFKKTFKSLDKKVKINGYLNNLFFLFLFSIPALFSLFFQSLDYEPPYTFFEVLIYLSAILLIVSFGLVSNEHGNFFVVFDLKDKKIRNRHKSLKFQLKCLDVFIKNSEFYSEMKDAGVEARRKKSK